MQAICSVDRDQYEPEAIAIAGALLDERGVKRLSGEQYRSRQSDFEASNWKLLSLTKTPVRATFLGLAVVIGYWIIYRLGIHGLVEVITGFLDG